jgi:hypothetical protein
VGCTRTLKIESSAQPQGEGYLPAEFDVPPGFV